MANGSLHNIRCFQTICVTLSVILLCCGATSAETKLSVGYEQNPPICFTDATGAPAGLSVSLLQHIAEQEGWQLDWKPCVWNKCLENLSSGEVDLLVGIGYSKEREARYSFTTEPVIINWGQLYAAKTQPISTIPDLEGKRVALVPTDLHGKAFREALVRFGVRALIVEVSSYAEGIKVVGDGKADVCVISRLFPLKSDEAGRVVQTPIILNPVPNMYAAASGSNPDILHAIDRHLDDLKKDKSSFYYRNQNKWLDIPDTQSIPVWIWFVMVGGTITLFTGMLWWRYRSLSAVNQQLSGVEKNMHTVFDNTDKGIIIHNLQGRVLAVNRPAQRLYGSTEAELMLLTVLDLSAESEDKHRQLPGMMARIAEGETMQMEWRCRNLAEGTSFDAEIFYTGIMWDNEAVLMGMVQDITKRKQRDALIRRLSTAIEQSANTVVITDRHSVIEYANPSFERMTGYEVAEAIGKTPRILKSGIHLPEYYEAMWHTLLAGQTWQGDFCNKRKNGELFWESAVVTPIMEGEKVTHFVAIKEDITLRKHHEEGLYRQANFDELTGLPNRNMLSSRIMETIANQQHCCKQIVLMLLDLDNFKMINDTLGHSMGDKLLQAVAERLASVINPEDMVARLGGDEFVIAPLHTCDATIPKERLAELVMTSFAKPFDLMGQEFFITASMGIVAYPEDGEGMETLLRNADAAMYHSKNKGRNSFEYYSKELNNNFHERLAMETMLRRALELNEFQVYYQPKQDLTTGRIASFEALLRWQPHNGEMIFPDKFIPLLEETGLIVPVGEWVLREVCRQVKRWNQNGAVIEHASVNISFQQFKRPDIVERILAIVEESGVDPARICLELTESIMMEDKMETLNKLHTLCSAGFSISLDDFGTGYSSLAYLREMPIHELKIDRSFVMTLPHENATLVNTIIGMAQSLGLRIVAEGVETEEQKDYLKANGCHVMQGYLLSRPLPVEQFELFINARVHSAAPHLSDMANGL